MGLDFAKGYAQYQAQQKDAEFGQALGSLVQQGMFPFHTGNVTLALTQDMNLYDFGRTLIIEIDSLRGYPFKYKFDEKTLWSAYDYEDLILTSIRKPLINHFRYRPSLPVDDHIVLGEE